MARAMSGPLAASNDVRHPAGDGDAARDLEAGTTSTAGRGWELGPAR
jgi:hypothetical protein